MLLLTPQHHVLLNRRNYRFGKALRSPCCDDSPTYRDSYHVHNRLLHRLQAHAQQPQQHWLTASSHLAHEPLDQPCTQHHGAELL
jgi:hypothetical protein